MMKLVIVDFDGTLCNTREAIAVCISRTFEAFGREPPRTSEIEEVVGAGLRIPDAFDVLASGGMNESQKGSWTQMYRTIYDDGPGLALTTMFDGVQDGLSSLKSAGCRVVVLSNKGQSAIEHAIEHFDIARFIDHVIGDRPDVPHKPDPASWHTAIQPLAPGITTSEVAVVGDTVADIAYGHALGAVVCWAQYGFGDSEACLDLAPDVVLRSFDELAPALNRLA